MPKVQDLMQAIAYPVLLRPGLVMPHYGSLSVTVLQ